MSFKTQLKFIQLTKQANLGKYLGTFVGNDGYQGFGLKNVNPTKEVLNYYTDCIPQVTVIGDITWTHPTLGVDKVSLEHLKKEL